MLDTSCDLCQGQKRRCGAAGRIKPPHKGRRARTIKTGAARIYYRPRASKYQPSNYLGITSENNIYLLKKKKQTVKTPDRRDVLLGSTFSDSAGAPKSGV